MGFLQTVALRGLDVTAQADNPRVISTGFSWSPTNIIGPVSRSDAMQVPAVRRARSIIAGTIASFSLELYDDATNAEIPDGLPWLGQPDPHMTRAAQIAATVDNLVFHGFAYWEVVTVIPGTDRPELMAFVNFPRVSAVNDPLNTVVDYYLVDGYRRPTVGVGSLITFQAEDEGFLACASAVIRRGTELQRAALNLAASPMPSGVLKNTGADLPDAKVLALLTGWKQSRRENATAYLSAQLEFQSQSYNAVEMAINEQIMNNAGDIALSLNLDPWYVNAQNASMTYSNRVDINKQLVNQTLRPYIDVIEQRLSMPDLCPDGYEVRFSLDEFLRADATARVAVLEKLLTLGIIDVAEARAMEDLAPRGSADPEGAKA